MSVRLGILRPDRPLDVVAETEARVIDHELSRRLGTVSLDLRVDGARIGRWQPRAHAAWPGDIDAVVDATTLWNDDLPPLTALFARTVDPDAAEVRMRMLHHLEVLPIERFDDARLAEWIDLGAIRPTDVWLALRCATSTDVTDPSVDALRQSSDEAVMTLDAAFDSIIDDLVVEAAPESTAAALRRALADADHAAARHAALADELVRVEREAADRIDELGAELRALEEQLDRTHLAIELSSPDEP